MGIALNVTSRDEDVPEIKRYISAIKGRVRDSENTRQV